MSTMMAYIYVTQFTCSVFALISLQIVMISISFFFSFVYVPLRPPPPPTHSPAEVPQLRVVAVSV